METSNMNIQVYKKPSPLKPIMLFLIGIIVGVGVTYIFFNLYSSPPESKPTPITQTPTSTPPSTSVPSPSMPLEKVTSQELTPTTYQYTIDNISPLILTVDMDRYTPEISTLLSKIKPFGVRITSSSDNFNPDKFIEISKNIIDTVQKENKGLPLIAIDSEILFSKKLPQFESQITIPQLKNEIDPIKVIEAGKNYADIARDLGIRIILGPMIELFVPGKSDESKKDLYFSDTPEIIQLSALSFVKGLMNGKILPVVKTFPAKTVAVKKEIDGKTVLALDVPSAEQDTNQAISMLATWLFPFSESAHEGIPAILISHTAIPILEPESPNQPCTTSEKIIRGLIREKWNYDGLLIAEDLMEYPITNEETYPNIALKMIAVGIDIISLSTTDEAEILKIVELIRNNLTEEYKQKINLRISNAISNILPIEPEIKKDYQTPPPSQPEQTLIAKEESTNALPTQTPDSSSEPQQTIPPTSEQPPQPTIPQSEEKGGSISTQIGDASAPQTPPAEAIPIAQESTPQSQIQQPETNITPPEPPVEKEKQSTELQPTSTSPKPPTAEKSTSPETAQEKTEPTPSSESKPSPEPKPQDKRIITTQVSKTGKTTLPPPGTKPIYHKISQGETLFSIARKYGVTPKEIITWNNIDNPNLIKYGLKLTIYVPENVSQLQQPQPQAFPQEPKQPNPPELEPISPHPGNITQSSQPQTQPQTKTETTQTTENITQPKEEPPSNNQYSTEITIYTVKHGDTLESIARDFRVTKEVIIQLNNLKKPYILPAGRKLKVPKVPPKVSFSQ